MVDKEVVVKAAERVEAVGDTVNITLSFRARDAQETVAAIMRQLNSAEPHIYIKLEPRGSGQ